MFCAIFFVFYLFTIIIMVFFCSFFREIRTRWKRNLLTMKMCWNFSVSPVLIIFLVCSRAAAGTRVVHRELISRARNIFMCKWTKNGNITCAHEIFKKDIKYYIWFKLVNQNGKTVFFFRVMYYEKLCSFFFVSKDYAFSIVFSEKACAGDFFLF